MYKQSSRILMDVTTEMWGIPATVADLWGFLLMFHLGSEEVEEIRVWVERSDKSQNARYIIQRSVVRFPQGHAEIGIAFNVKITERVYAQEVHQHLKELLYIWTRDEQVDSRVFPFLEQNLRRLREPKRHQWEGALVSAMVYMYEVIPTDQEVVTHSEILRCMGRVATKAGLRQVVLELPHDCALFEIHMEASGQIIGNASYHVLHNIDPATGKREMLIIQSEFGSCANIHYCFRDLYNTDEEFERSLELKL